MLLLTLLACERAKTVVWTSLATDDVAEDAAAELFTLGLHEDDDRALLQTLHATGTYARMEVSGPGVAVAHEPRVQSRNDDVCIVGAAEATDVSEVVTLNFVGPGSTDLLVTDNTGLILDWQAIEVRDPVDAALYAYDAVAVADFAALETLDVIPGSAVTVAVTWRSALDETLAGTGLLDVAPSGDWISAQINGALEGNAFEAFDLDVDTNAVSGSGVVSLYAGSTLAREVGVVIHDASEITGVTLASDIEVHTETDTAADTGGEVIDAVSGTIRAVVTAGDVSLIGVPVTWYENGTQAGVGAWVVISGEDSTEANEISACWGDLCSSDTVPGRITSIGGTTALESTDFCGCAHAGPLGWGLSSFALAAAVTLRRRRRES